MSNPMNIKTAILMAKFLLAVLDTAPLTSATLSQR